MDILVRDVIWATGLRREVVKPAIGFVLQYLRNEAPEPEAHVDEFVDKLRAAREALRAAAVIGGGTNAAIESLSGTMGYEPRADTDLLAKELKELGLNETQVTGLVKQIIARAERLIGKKDVVRIQQLLSALERRQAPREPE